MVWTDIGDPSLRKVCDPLANPTIAEGEKAVRVRLTFLLLYLEL